MFECVQNYWIINSLLKFVLKYGILKVHFTWMSLSLSLKTVQESLFKIFLERHSFVPKHFSKIDCEVRILAAKNYQCSLPELRYFSSYLPMCV